MIWVICTFLEFCYIIRWHVINQSTLTAINNAIQWVHAKQDIFIATEVHDNFSLPRQHSITHYSTLIKMFGTPNGLCSSLTESHHIRAVKEPWWCSNHYEALGQMLVMNQHIDKLAAA